MVTSIDHCPDHSGSITCVLNRLCNGFFVETIERFIEIIDVFYTNILNDNVQSSYASRKEFSILVWTEMAIMVKEQLDSQREMVDDWNENPPNRFKLMTVLYNILMWPLSRSMDEIGVSMTELSIADPG